MQLRNGIKKEIKTKALGKQQLKPNEPRQEVRELWARRVKSQDRMGEMSREVKVLAAQA